jgi:hypothetical protein
VIIADHGHWPLADADTFCMAWMGYLGRIIHGSENGEKSAPKKGRSLEQGSHDREKGRAYAGSSETDSSRSRQAKCFGPSRLGAILGCYRHNVDRTGPTGTACSGRAGSKRFDPYNHQGLTEKGGTAGTMRGFQTDRKGV